MKYIYTLGPWKEFYGYIFWDGKPTEVTDRATLERLQKEDGFKAVEVEEVPIQPQETQDGEVQEGQGQASSPVLKGKECNKCHKLIPRGWYMHQKWCKG